ncbi:hypothetical protein MC885_007537, partial [Smutsia gigantea]
MCSLECEAAAQKASRRPGGTALVVAERPGVEGLHLAPGPAPARNAPQSPPDCTSSRAVELTAFCAETKQALIMPIRPVGWISRQVLKNFSGRIEGIQKVIMDLVDEFKNKFPTILRLPQSNQKREQIQKTSKIRMSIALAKISRETLIQGLNSISRSSKSVSRLPQPQLACRLLELRDISLHLLREVNAPKQPLYNMQVRRGSLFEIISFPAKTALTSIIYASFAALIYLTICVNAVLEKVKKIFQEEESIRQNREENENLRRAFSELVLSAPVFSD